MNTRHLARLTALVAGSVNGRRMMKDVRFVHGLDRRVSFDAFRQTVSHLAKAYAGVGADTAVYAVPTGAGAGSGRWIIPESYRLRRATASVVAPVRAPLLDSRRNPFHVAMFTGSTPPGGVTAPLVALDTPAAFEALTPGELKGRLVLTVLQPRRFLDALRRSGAAGVLSDYPVPGSPDAVTWLKLGFGGLRPEHRDAPPVVLALSARQGSRLRAWLAAGRPVRLRVAVTAEHGPGVHEVLSAFVRGSDPGAGEVWASSHIMEPGALDNASGTAVCLEIARTLEGLMTAGLLPRPRRTIRFVHGYECFGPFALFERERTRIRVHAGMILDAVGSRPGVSEGLLAWHAAVPQADTGPHGIGLACLRAALRLRNPGYRLRALPFSPSSENLLGDPQFGFPCPWLTTCYKPGGRLYDAYHSQADTVRLLDPAGLEVAAAAMGACLYALAAEEEAPPRRVLPDRPGAWRRTQSLTPLADELPLPMAQELAGLDLPPWTLYWADGRRSDRAIRAAVERDRGCAVSASALARFFEWHRKVGFVERVPVVKRRRV